MSSIIFGNSSGSGGGSGGVTSLNNGLTLTGTNGQLGGDLVTNTLVSFTGYTLQFNGNGSVSTFVMDGVSNTYKMTIQNVYNTVMFLSDGAFEIGVFGFGTDIGINGSVTQTPTIFDSINQVGLNIASSAYYANFSALTYITRGYADARYLLSGEVPVIVAKQKVAGIASTQTLITYVLPLSNPCLYRATGSVVFRSGAGSAQLLFQYVDTAGVTQYLQISSSSGAGNVYNTPDCGYAINGTSLVISVEITGTAIVDVAVVIEYLY